MRDSTVTKRQEPKKRALPKPLDTVYKDLTGGFGELKRQTGAAVERVKEGYRKIRQSLR